MALREKLEEDIKTSMPNHDQPRIDALRFFKNADLAVEKEQKNKLAEVPKCLKNYWLSSFAYY